jgi:hypothetical protein
MTPHEQELLEVAALIGETRIRTDRTIARSRALMQTSRELIEDAKRAKAGLQRLRQRFLHGK